MRAAKAILAVGVALLLISGAVSAHHSFAAEFDAAKPLNLTGTFTKIEWTNPHAHVYLDVKTPDGKLTSWRVELGTPNDLTRGGWMRDTLKAGDRMTVIGYAAKDGSRFVTGRSVTLSDGRVLFARDSTSKR
jgi:hypothetical protein